MDNKRTTILAFVAVAVMLAVCFIGFAVVGDDGSDADTTGKVEMKFTGTVTVDDKEFNNDFQGAIDAAKSSTSKTIKFTKESSFNKTGTYDNEGNDWSCYDVSGLTIDLSGHTVTIERKMALILTGDKEFKLCNGTINAAIEKEDSQKKPYSYALFIGTQKATATPTSFTKVTLENINFLGGVNISDGYDVSVKDLNVEGTRYYSLYNQGGSILTVNDATYKSQGTTAGYVLCCDGRYGTKMIIEAGQFCVASDQELSNVNGSNLIKPTIKGGFFYKVGGDSDSKLKNELQGYLADGYQIVNATYGENTGYEVIGTASIETGGKIVYYASIQDAIDAATDRQTVKLLRDVTLSKGEVITVSKKMTFDLNGHSITGEASTNNIVQVLSGGDLTIVGTQDGSKMVSSIQLIMVKGASDENRAKLTIESGTFEAVECCVGGFSYSDVVINGGTFTSTDNGVVMMNGTQNTSSGNYGGNVNITITGGTFNANIKTKGYIAMGVYACNSIGVTITGGTFNVKDGVGVVWRSGDLTVGKDVKFVITNSSAEPISGKAGDASTLIQAGQVIACSPNASYASLGTYSGVDCFDAKIGNVYYTYLKDAVASATTGQTVEILRNVTLTESIVIDDKQSVTIDLNGNNITGNIKSTSGTTVDNADTGAGHVFVNYGELTIEGAGTVQTTMKDTAVILNLVSGTVVLNGGTYTTADGNGYYVLKNLGTMTINSGVTVKVGTMANASLVASGWYDGEENTTKTESTLTVNGGTFVGGLNTFKNDDWGVATINDGTFTNNTQCSVMNWNVLTVNGGIFRQNEVASKPVITTGYINTGYDKGITTINGGTFYAGKSNVCVGLNSSTGVTYTINGGTFSDLSGIAYVTKNGTYELNTSASLSKSISMESGATLSVGRGTTLTIPEDIVFSGIVAGPDNNTLVANNMKAGTGGITITGGSLIINGVVRDDVKSGDTVKVSGESIKIQGTLDAGVTLVVEKGTSVVVETAEGKPATLTVNGTITNNGVIKVEQSSALKIDSTATLVNQGTVELKDTSTVTGTIDNTKGIVGDNRTTSNTVTVTGGTVITDSTEKSKAYADEGATVIDGTVQDVEDGGTVTATNGVFVITNDVALGDDGLRISMGGTTYVLLRNATLSIGDKVSLNLVSESSKVIKYEIDTPNAMGFKAVLKAPAGFDGVKVKCDNELLDSSDVRYDSTNGEVTFYVDHNSVFTITGYMNSGGSTTIDNNADERLNSNTMFVSSIVVLVVAILALAIVIKRR